MNHFDQAQLADALQYGERCNAIAHKFERGLRSTEKGLKRKQRQLRAAKDEIEYLRDFIERQQLTHALDKEVAEFRQAQKEERELERELEQASK
jgi:hypothetical protein